MPSELLKLVNNCVLAQFLTLTILPSQLDLLILVLTMPQHLKFFSTMKLQKICLSMSGISQEFATGAS